MARSRRTPAMLVGRCSSQLSSHRLQAKSKKSQAPTEAYPDFLPLSAGQSRVCAFLFKERCMRSANATKVHRKSGVAKWRDLHSAEERVDQDKTKLMLS